MNDIRAARAVRYAAEHKDTLKRLLDLDYTALERRVMAAVGTGEDIHVASASFFYGVPENEIMPAQREQGKILNYAIGYNLRYGKPGDTKALADLLERATVTTGRKYSTPEIQNIPVGRI